MADRNIIADGVQAKHFQLVDDHDKVLAQLGSGPNGAVGLEFYHGGDVPRLSIGTDNAGTAALTMYDSTGTTRVRLNVDDSGTRTQFAIRDASNRIRAQILLQEDGGVGITLSDEWGHKSASLESHADGFSYVALYDKDGNVVSGLSNGKSES